jgi:nicotinamide mononucleotide (NMN) deamidase PncC
VPAKPKYHDGMPEMAHRLALLGIVDDEIADVLNVSTRQLHRWKKLHHEFAEALASGKVRADAAVAAALFKRATGYTAPDGRHVPPDTGALCFWLKNRQPERWRDRVEFEQKHRFSDADREALRKIHEQALEHAEQQRRAMLGRAERLGLTLEAEEGALFDLDSDGALIGADDDDDDAP